MTKIATANNLANLFNKALPQKVFERHLDSVVIMSCECKWQFVGIVPSNYSCILETLTFYMDISFYISLCMCHKMIIIILKYHSR